MLHLPCISDRLGVLDLFLLSLQGAEKALGVWRLYLEGLGLDIINKHTSHGIQSCMGVSQNWEYHFPFIRTIAFEGLH